MKLIYSYIKKFRNIKCQEVYFSNDFTVHYNDSLAFPDSLSVLPRHNDNNKCAVFPSSKLANAHVIVGKTGAGKTNILQMIGMTEEERLHHSEPDDSYFLLYKDEEGFLIEPFNIPVRQEKTRQAKRGPEEVGLSESTKQYFKLRDSMQMYRFNVDDKGVCVNIESARDLGKRLTYVFTGVDKHSFPHYPYDDERKEGVDPNTCWMPRYIAEYHRTALWNSCRFLAEYVNEFAEGSIKRKAAIVIENRNWAEKIKQHIDDKLKEHDYWTFIERRMKDDVKHFLGKKVKKRKPISVKHQFIHDLWADYAIYLRKWISYIETFSEETPEDYLDSSETVDVYQEFLDYYFEKEQEESGDTSGIDPTDVPDFERISILKRIEWLSMYIDRKGDGVAKGLLWQIYTDIRDIGFILGKLDEKYFTSSTFTMPVTEMYTDENRLLIEDLFERMEMYRPDNVGIFTERLLPYRFAYISSGEYQYAKVMGGIEEYCVKLSLGENQDVNKLDNKPNVLYLLDEPETYMHPELCRTFMNRLDRILRNRVADTDIQIIITTHSPLLLSDVLPEQITRLDVDDLGYCIVKNGTEKAYFGANIHTILSDGFFLHYTIGEYARLFLQKKMDLLNDGAEGKEIEEIRRVVPLIGDAVIRGSFKQKLRQINGKIE